MYEGIEKREAYSRKIENNGIQPQEDSNVGISRMHFNCN